MKEKKGQKKKRKETEIKEESEERNNGGEQCGMPKISAGNCDFYTGTKCSYYVLYGRWK